MGFLYFGLLSVYCRNPGIVADCVNLEKCFILQMVKQTVITEKSKIPSSEKKLLKIAELQLVFEEYTESLRI